MRLSATLIAAVTLTMSPLALALAQDPRLLTPQPEHALLKRMAGEWQFERFSPVPGDAEPQRVGTGTVSAEMVGDFFVVSRWSGSVFGMDYSGLQALGYDIEKEGYTGSWIDGFMSHHWELNGSIDEAGEELTVTTRGPAPTGGTTTFRELYRFVSPDSMTIIGEMQDGDAWTTLTTTHLTRTASGGDGSAP